MAENDTPTNEAGAGSITRDVVAPPHNIKVKSHVNDIPIHTMGDKFDSIPPTKSNEPK